MWMLRYWWQWPDAGTQCKIMRMIIMIIMTTPTRYSVYGDWECKRHRVFLPFGQQKEPYDKVVTIVLMVTMMIMMINRRSPLIMSLRRWWWWWKRWSTWGVEGYGGHVTKMIKMDMMLLTVVVDGECEKYDDQFCTIKMVAMLNDCWKCWKLRFLHKVWDRCNVKLGGSGVIVAWPKSFLWV